MRILTKMYNILGLLEQAVAETDEAKRALYEQAKGFLVSDERYTKQEVLYQSVFGTCPNRAEFEQMDDTCHELITQGSIRVSSRQIYAMELGGGEKIPFAETGFFKTFFDANQITQEKINSFKKEIGRAELSLCKIGAIFCQNYYQEDAGLDFWDRLVADNDQTLLQTLYLSNGMLRSLGEHRATTRQFDYLKHDLHSLTEKQLSEIRVRTGEISPARVAYWLYGEQYLSADTEDFIMKAVRMACDSKNHNCWSELLHLEFGTYESTADQALGGVTFEYPLDSLQRKLRDALYAINDYFLVLRAPTKRRHNHHNSGGIKRPYVV